MDNQTRNALREGLADAAGFVIGSLAGWQLGKLLGLDFFAAPDAFGWREMAGLALIALGCGVGKLVARRLIAPPSST
ncbi:hypothetical protein [Hydrogenophaga sp. PBL-H3]|uniref:hypothetical protein n=1 Tax=Hydrogenophaga sp. PBL-H3 TaxID=434010 RepID=UPI0013203A7B|nr:hypothetical protein [Hydrogenophaga sp. PBL-H3]QHE75288.1 hypothetical protein F9Z45_04055 [Hydrogenophaga sp. PBL-H3]QHE79715.1 hypothetical protein F9Z44_04055 [Hydrogenophaga sp. PBL-H3]